MSESVGADGGRRSKRGKPSLSDEELDRVKAAACEALDEVWEKFTSALHETEGEYAASIGVTCRYKPASGSEQNLKPACVEVFGKASLPTHKKVFEARVSGGQLTLSLGYDA